MNERIRQLAEQAHCYACEYARHPDYNEHTPYNQGMYKQRYDSKFAELIVQECAGRVDWILAEGGRTQGDLIREHFGVES